MIKINLRLICFTRSGATSRISKGWLLCEGQIRGWDWRAATMHCSIMKPNLVTAIMEASIFFGSFTGKSVRGGNGTVTRATTVKCYGKITHSVIL